jgi:hypothetical protein
MECYDVVMAIMEMTRHAIHIEAFADIIIVEWDTGITNAWRWMPDINAFCFIEGSDA